MTNEIKHTNTTGHGDYERRDIGVAGVLYFLAGLVAAGLLVHFLITGLYSYLDKKSNVEQPPLSPLMENVRTDERHVPKDYPQATFPSPKLEEDERGQLNGIRLQEEETLSSYGWVDQNAGTVRIPIDRAMDLIAQRGLPVRAANAATEGAGKGQQAPMENSETRNKGTKKQ